MRAIVLSLVVITSPDLALAFNTSTHHQILNSALFYLQTHVSESPLLDDWLSLASKNQSDTNIDPMQRLLVRSVIDTDYQDDLWLDSWYLRPIAAGRTNVLGMLTSLYHFTNVTKPGRFWRYDGYAYQNTDGLGNDAYLGTMSLEVRVDLSAPMQKYASHQENALMAETAMPPSYLIAVDAFEEAVNSWPSMQSARTTWQKELTYAYSYLLNLWMYRQYAEEKIAGLPANFQKIGIAIHMAQDLAMPHHSQGIAGLCHSELESYIDTLACPEGNEAIDEIYDVGIFDELVVPVCQELYEVREVEKLMMHPIFNVTSGMSLEDRLIGLAMMSAQFRVRPTEDFSNNAMLLTFDNRVLFDDTCDNIQGSKSLQMIAKRQYQLATAATVMLIELAAYEYSRRTQLLVEAQRGQCEICEPDFMSC